jgi:hypothetical protein
MGFTISASSVQVQGGWLAEGSGEWAAVLTSPVQVAQPAQQLHEPDRSAERFWLGQVLDLRFGGLCRPLGRRSMPT